MGGNLAAGSGGGRTGGGGAAAPLHAGSSRCGLPHLWQKRASSGSFAPQVQYSGTPSVWHVILDLCDVRFPHLLVIADPAAPFLKSLARVPEQVRTIVSNDPEQPSGRPRRRPTRFCSPRAARGLLTAVLPLASNVRWIHSLWTGVERHPDAGDAGASGARSPTAAACSAGLWRIG